LYNDDSSGEYQVEGFVMKLTLALSAFVLLAFATQLPAQDDAKSSPQALTVYSDAANFQNNGEFELATEEWEKFLKRFPKDPLAKKAEHYAGVCYQQIKNYDKAIAHYSAVLKADPKFELAEDARLNLGWCLYTSATPDKPEKLEAAAKALSTSIKQFPKGKYVDQALFYLGEARYAQQKKPEAIAAYKQLVEGHPKSALRSDGLYALGTTYEEVQQFKQAGAIYDLFVKEFPDSALFTEVRMRKAETVLQGGDAAAAEKMFAEVAAVEGFAAADHALFREAFCAAKQNKFVAAAKLYSKIATDFPQSRYVNEAALSAGRTYYRGNELGEAAQWFEKTIAADPDDAPEAAHWLCRIHLKNGKPAEAAALAKRMLPKAAANPFLVNLQMDEADALFETPDQREQALARYLKIASDHADDPLAPQALYNAAFTALELKKYKEGLKHAEAFASKYPQDRFLPDTKYVAADCNLKLGKHAAAEAGYRDLLKNYKQHSEYETWRVRLGLSLYLQKKYADAVSALAIVGELKTPDLIAEGNFLLGASQFQLGKFQEAADALTASLAAAPKWRQADETLLFLSRSQRGLDKLDAAKATVSKLIKQFPNSSILDQANFRLGEYNYATGNFPEAEAAYEVVITKSPDSIYAPYALYGKGWSQLKAKQFADGAASFTAMIDKFSDHTLVPDAHFGRAMCRRQAGEFAKAISDLAVFLKSNPPQAKKSDALYERGLAEVALKQLDQATATFTSLLADDKAYASAANVLYELAWAYQNQDKVDQATKAFAKLAGDFPASPLAPEANLHVAEAHYDKQEFDEAIKFYKAAKEKAKPGEVAERATHKLGWALFRSEKYEPALAEFEAQTKAYAKGKLSADGLFMKAETLFKLDRYDAALVAFKAAIAKPSADKQKQVLALLHGGQSAGQAGKWQDSLKLLDQIPAKFPDTPLMAEAIYERGFAKQNLNETDAAIKDYEKAAELSRGAIGARAQFMIGEVLFEQKQFADAIRHFKRVMYGYGGEKAPADVKSWQALAGYEAGRCAEVGIKDEKDAARRAKLIADAKASFKYVVERHPQHEKVKQAKQRLEALAKL